ncbi:hypothetical protein MAR_033394 [Mya arenaria]|uniref:Uncharacterized protein n=1 Tax=Mya arenaria TaxID=6604 RepID=A0ABY7GBY1_MYAAR|nr:hypothetical protein MAR_033394 [Mya arenaria]
MKKRTYLQSLCETRWANRALFTFKASYTTMVNALEVARARRRLQGASYIEASFGLILLSLLLLLSTCFSQGEQSSENNGHGFSGDRESFRRKVVRWRVRWSSEETKSCELSATLKDTIETLYPDITICLVVLITMPVSTTLAERKLSIMRRV